VPVSVKLTVTVEAMALLERAWVTSWETLPALESFPTGGCGEGWERREREGGDGEGRNQPVQGAPPALLWTNQGA